MKVPSCCIYQCIRKNWTAQPNDGERRRVESLAQTRAALAELLDGLQEHCGWRMECIHLFGFGQGGTAALDLLQSRRFGSCLDTVTCRTSTRAFTELSFKVCRGAQRLGSCISVSGVLLSEALLRQTKRKGAATPVLITHGGRDPDLPTDLMRKTATGLRESGQSPYSLIGLGHTGR